MFYATTTVVAANIIDNTITSSTTIIDKHEIVCCCNSKPISFVFALGRISFFHWFNILLQHTRRLLLSLVVEEAHFSFQFFGNVSRQIGRVPAHCSSISNIMTFQRCLRFKRCSTPKNDGGVMFHRVKALLGSSISMIEMVLVEIQLKLTIMADGRM